MINKITKLLSVSLLFFLFCATSNPPTAELDKLIDSWHKYAADASLEPYFAKTSEDFIFLGTAPGERWTKDVFYSFCKPYFDKGKAWDFTAKNRKWNFDKKNKLAWFDEDLDTWMGTCRGSGICRKIKGEWKISYYNLTVLIENEKIKEFIALRGEVIAK